MKYYEIYAFVNDGIKLVSKSDTLLGADSKVSMLVEMGIKAYSKVVEQGE